jgi:hypothetical protein
MTSLEGGAERTSVDLAEGFVARADITGTRLEVRGPEGGVRLVLRVGPEGLVLEVAATQLSLRAEALTIGCGTLTVDAGETVLRTGALSVAVDGAAALAAADVLSLTAPLIELN